jgi:hypothetical protein
MTVTEQNRPLVFDRRVLRKVIKENKIMMEHGG